jgi:hypothetical protein
VQNLNIDSNTRLPGTGGTPTLAGGGSTLPAAVTDFRPVALAGVTNLNIRGGLTLRRRIDRRGRIDQQDGSKRTISGPASHGAGAV